MKEAKVTIIVPTYNETFNIERFEEDISRLKGSFDIIFTDGFSKDGSYEQIRYPKIQEARGRGAQLNTGAALAKTEYLWFVHVDSIPHPDSIEAIENSNADVGCFTLKFDKRTPLMKFEQWCSNIRVPMRNIAFGDQGIFMKRELFEEIGGYKDIPIMEDYQLSIDIKNIGLKFKQLKLPIRVSARKFRDEGIIKMIIKMQYLQHLYRKGEDIEKIREIYYD